MRIAICDDEINVTDQIKRIVEEYAFEKKIVVIIDIFQSGKELLEKEKHFDAIFLDIDMKGMNGITIAKELRETDTDVKIIYVTNYADYQNYAFRVHAFEYLLKPINSEQIYQVLNDIINYTKADLKLPCLDIYTTEGNKNMLMEDIYYFEYHDRQVVMFTKQGRYFLKHSLSQIKDMLGSYQFAMPHKSFIVNLIQVKCIRGYTVYLMDGSTIPLSQKKSVYFRKQLNYFIEKQMTW